MDRGWGVEFWPGVSEKRERVVCVYVSVQFSSAAQSCPILCDPMDWSMPGFPVHHQFPELVYVWVGLVFAFFFFFFLYFGFFCLFLAVLRGLRGLSYMTSDGTCVSCSGRVEP